MMVAGGAKTGEEMSPELVVVIPVYNEQASLRKVIREWYLEIENWTEDFVILVMNDGSTDRSPDIVERLQEQLGDRIRLHTHTNRGHGLTCLVGYERALELGARYVFQIDSDGQCDPQYFFRVWRQRDQSQVVYGWRKARDDGWRRVLASRLLRMVLLATARVWCVDANTPYRLMHASVLKEPVARLKATHVDLTNIGLAVLLKRMSVTHGTVPIRFRERYGGEPNVGLGQFGVKAVELVRQLRGMM
jgi:dolichol-phosphate mannosyltransferase